MRTIYNLDPNPDPDDKSNRVEYPICGQGAVVDPDNDYECNKCKSKLYISSAFEVQILINNLTISKKNIIAAAMLVAVAIISTILSYFYFNVGVVGFILMISPAIVVYQNTHFGIGTRLQQSVDLYFALVSMRLRHYDLGSKILAYTIIGTMVFGLIVMIVAISLKM